MAAETAIARAERIDGQLSSWLAAYRPLPDAPDELIGADGAPRPHWLPFLTRLADLPQAELEKRFELATRHIRDTGVSYRIYGEESERTWLVNPLPLLMDAAEWSEIAEGVRQRASLLEALLRDIYGEARLITEGHLPAAAVTGSHDFIRAMRGMEPPGGRWLNLVAVDIGRGPDGRWWVLDDRAQAPSGPGYALENRLVLSRAFPGFYNSSNVERLAPFFSAFRDGLTEAAARSEPRICLLTPGPYSETYFEQAHLARYLGFLLVEGEDLVARDGRVHVRTIAGLKRADVIWRRVDADFIDPLELNGASRLGVPGLLDAMRAGGVAVANMPGSGVVESRALLGFLPALSRRILGEDLKLPNIATWWCGQPAERELVTERIDSLAIAGAFGGDGPGRWRGPPTLVADLSAGERDALVSAIRDRPFDFVGQEVVRLSTTPAWRDGQLTPSPFVLRVYAAATKDGWRVMPGGFCRISDRADARAVSMGEGAEAVDVWVLSDEPVERVSLLAARDNVKVRRIPGQLPSRAADNLFWLARYLERAEATVRLVRSLCTSLMESEAALHSAGETLVRLKGVLFAWGAIRKDGLAGRARLAAANALRDERAAGAVINLVRSARRAASSTRERLSADFWKLLVDLEARLDEAAAAELGQAGALERAEAALQVFAALSGLAQEDMNRLAGWRFFDMGRRVERGINTCRFTRNFAADDASPDDLDLMLDLADSQITYRARYLEGVALAPVRDLVMLDPYNPRSTGFQIAAVRDHLAALPVLREDGILEEPRRLSLKLSGDIEAEDASALGAGKILVVEQRLMALSDAISTRYFPQGSGAAPSAKQTGLG